MGTITVYRKSKTGATEKMTVNDSPASLAALNGRRGKRITKSELGVKTAHDRPYANPWRPDEERERKEAEAEKAKKSKKG